MKYLLIALVLVAVIGGGWYYSNKAADSTTDNPQTTSTPTKQEAQPSGETASSDSESTQPGAYVDYSGTVIANTAGTKILFFHASWCPQCRALEADIKANTIPTGVTIIKTDYDTNQTLRQKYGVTIQTSLVRVDDSGNLVEKYVAYDSPTLQSVKDNLL